VVAAIAIADASNPSAILFISTSRNYAASLLRGVFIVDAIMPQPTPSGKPQPTPPPTGMPQLVPPGGMSDW
jgi:hypothetical protein